MPAASPNCCRIAGSRTDRALRAAGPPGWVGRTLTANRPENATALRGCSRSWSLADEDSQRRLAAQGLHISATQRDRLLELSTWPVDVVGADTMGCIVNGRCDQAALDRYFEILDRVAALGRSAPTGAIARCIAAELADGLASALMLAVRCGLFSDAVAHEARCLLLAEPEWRRGPDAADALEWYRLAMETTREAIDRASS